VRSARPVPPFVCTLAIVVACGGCGGARGADDAREALLVQTLVEADRELAFLRPERVAAKYVLMQSGAQPFLRGTAGVFYRDLTRLFGDGIVAHAAESELTQLFGDLHLENAGATYDADGMLFECIDHDATVRGPPAWDVRRAALGLAVGVGEARPGAIDRAVAALAAAYADGLDLLVAGAPPSPLRAPLGAIVDDLLAKGAKRRDSREELTRYTRIDPETGRRRLLRNDEQVDLRWPFSLSVDHALARYRATRKGGRGDDAAFALKDAVEKLGSGIASYANLRYWLLVEGPTPGEDDDLLLELKEERDPPQPVALLGRGPTTLGAPVDNGRRVLEGALSLHASPTEEPDLGAVTVEGVAFQVRSVSRARRDVDVADLTADLTAGTYDDADVEALGAALGRLLAGAHARSVAPTALVATLGPRSSWVATVVADAAADRARLLADRALFDHALATRGPLLGARQ